MGVSVSGWDSAGDREGTAGRLALPAEGGLGNAGCGGMPLLGRRLMIGRTSTDTNVRVRDGESRSGRGGRSGGRRGSKKGEKGSHKSVLGLTGLL